jgi:serine peptidase DegS
MSKAIELLGFLAKAAIAGLALAFVLVYLWPSLSERLARQEDPAPPPAESIPVSYTEAVNRTAPAVVSITTRSTQIEQSAKSNALYRMRQRLDVASGVLLSDDGYILTNHHVINRVQGIQIFLWDGRVVPARIVGSDPATDLAVLKIDLSELPVAPIAENPQVRVGDVVLAIGNALGLSHTVTMGIVSATGRNDLGSLLFQDFIQTDAAINSGNSGGPLINARGDVIGINTRNLDSRGGAQNIGFAIPIGLARNVMQQIIGSGSVQRGWLGAIFSDIRPSPVGDGSLARRGISVREVASGGPAWDAGIRQGDVILRLDGEPVVDANQFLLAVSQRQPGNQVEIQVSRGDETFETYATLIQQPPIQ